MKQLPVIWLTLSLFSLFHIFPPMLAFGQDPFLENVRTTAPLSPEEERQSFRLPPGFEIQLVAAEPEIQKPLNMAFDGAGRLWVTDTVEYPYAAPLDRAGRDTLKVLSDFGPDGRASKVTTFADGLNIPIGIYPFRDGAIAYSIPHIWRFFDEDGDGRSERRERLYGPFGYERDTHGMNNAFRRGFDGWLYACHGFNNLSNVSGADGHRVSMASGNTYRMRVDGGRIEQFTFGQVNPFGMALDPLGNIFTADCHSKPVYALLRNGQYPGFGRPHDGLGFVEPLMQHLHDSTAISGVAVYADEVFPEEYRGNLYSGNVMTSRVNRDSLVYRGATIVAREEPDFLTTTDPWFRPVDIQLGPDGALYVADFYNRIIGHYEVALEHPGRDRDRGRIWRIVYTGEPREKAPDLKAASTSDLLAALDHANLTVRLLATDQIVDRVGAAAVEPALAAWSTSNSPRQKSHLLWVLYRLQALPADIVSEALAADDKLLRTHVLKVMSETADWPKEWRELAIKGLADPDAFVRRAAADALGRSPSVDNVARLASLVDSTPAEDHHLRYVALRSLSDQLRDETVFAQVRRDATSDAQLRCVAEAAIAVPGSESAAFLLGYLQSHDSPRDVVATQLQHVAHYLPADESARLAEFARSKFADDIDFQIELLRAAVAGLEQRGAKPAAAVRQWGADLAARLLAPAGAARGEEWRNRPVAGKPRIDNPWVLQTRASADGDTNSPFLCSLPRGEQLTGALRSPEFVIPPQIAFYAAGHIGAPGQPVVAMNHIRLRRADTGEIVAEATPPRNDTAQRIEWKLGSHAGQRGYLEIMDGDERGAYAWLAVGRFEPAVVALPSVSPSTQSERRQHAAALAAMWDLKDLSPALTELLASPDGDPRVRESCAQALARFRDDSRAAALAPLLADAETPSYLRDAIGSAIAGAAPGAVEEALTACVRAAPRRLQESLALSLAGDRVGAEALLALVADGKASARLLVQPAVRERLIASKLEEVENQIAALTAGLPSEDDAVRQLTETRRRKYASIAPSAANGAQVYEKNCAVCHQLKGQGPLVGPQLDGIGNRGLTRLLEDMLDPNRNVNAAFRTTSLRTADGKVVTGLLRREEGETLVLVDDKGKEFTVAKADVEEQAKSSLSLMPQNVAQTIPESDFFDLMAFLLEQTAAAK